MSASSACSHEQTIRTSFFVLSSPPPFILVNTFLTYLYTEALPANTHKATSLLSFPSPLKISFIIKCGSELSWWGPVISHWELFLKWEPNSHSRLSSLSKTFWVGNILSYVLAWVSLGKSLLCDDKIIQTKTSMQSHYLMLVTFATSINVFFHQQLNDIDVNNIICSLMSEELFFLLPLV